MSPYRPEQKSEPDGPFCQNPMCGKPVKQGPRGRPRKYCDDACRQAGRRAGAKSRSALETGIHDLYARQIAADVRGRGDRLEQLIGQGEEGVMPAFREVIRLSQDADDLKVMLIQRARDRKIPMRDIAAALHLHDSTVRRHSRTKGVDDRMRDRGRRNQPGPGRSGSAPGQDGPDSGSARGAGPPSEEDGATAGSSGAAGPADPSKRCAGLDGEVRTLWDAVQHVQAAASATGPGDGAAAPAGRC